MNITDPLAQVYCEAHSSAEDPLLEKIRIATQSHPEAHMLSGPLQGLFLEWVSWMLKPRFILEIGTFTGYSALCLAKGLAPGGQLHTIELRPEAAQAAASHFAQSNALNQIILHQGNALDIIPGLTPVWDLIFLDGDKTGYLEYCRMLFPRMSPEGLMIVDNVLFHGKVLAPEAKGKNAKAIQEFNEEILRDSGLEVLMLPMRDGLTLLRKKQNAG